MINIVAFRESLKNNQPPNNINGLVQAMWWEAKGNWDKAHKIAQDISGADAAWVHAYLHRKEGDEGNAGYWYSRARKLHCQDSFDREWEIIVDALLTQN